MEFAYNNSYHSSIGITPYEALNERKCKSPLCWCDLDEETLYENEAYRALHYNIMHCDPTYH